MRIKNYEQFREVYINENKINEEIDLWQSFKNLFKSKSLKDWEDFNQKLLDKFDTKESIQEFEDELDFRLSMKSSNLRGFCRSLVDGLKNKKIINPFKKDFRYEKLSEEDLFELKKIFEELLSKESKIKLQSNDFQKLIDEYKKQYKEIFEKNKTILDILKAICYKNTHYSRKNLNEVLQLFNYTCDKISTIDCDVDTLTLSVYNLITNINDLKNYEEISKVLNSLQKNSFDIEEEQRSYSGFVFCYQFLAKFTTNKLAEIIEFFNNIITKIEELKIDKFIEVSEKLFKTSAVTSSKRLVKFTDEIESMEEKIKEEKDIISVLSSSYFNPTELKNLLLKISKFQIPTQSEFLQKITISTEEIIKENNLTDKDIYFTHSSASPNLTRDKIKFEVEDRGNMKIDSEGTPVNRYGLYLTIYKRDKVDSMTHDAIHYIQRVFGMMGRDKAYVYVFTIAPNQRFLKSVSACFGQTNKSTKEFAQFCMKLGISGYYDPSPYGKSGNRISAMELCLVDERDIVKIHRIEINDSPKEKTGFFDRTKGTFVIPEDVNIAEVN